MALITLPAAARIKNIEWTLDQPAQVNRSDWTKRRQVVLQPGAALWSATCDLVVRIGEAAMLDVEAFLVDLEGQVNSFHLPIADNDQLPGPQAVVVDGAGQSGRSLAVRGGLINQRLLRGHKITVNDQTVMLMSPLIFDSNGKATATFKPSLRVSPADGASVEVVRPYVPVSLTTSQIGWTVAPGGLYQTKQLVLEEVL